MTRSQKIGAAMLIFAVVAVGVLALWADPVPVGIFMFALLWMLVGAFLLSRDMRP